MKAGTRVEWTKGDGTILRGTVVGTHLAATDSLKTAVVIRWDGVEQLSVKFDTRRIRELS